MATRHELIHIDFVANAGKANPVLKSLQVSCNDARIAKEQLDAQLKDAKAMNAPAEVITNLEKKLKSQTTTWQQLERGLREYTKGIDTLSKGIKEFNDGTLDEMSAKFNKAVYNSAKLAQSAVKTGSSDWNQLQRLMDATDRNVTRAREDIDLMMQSIKDGSAVSTVQLTRSREVLEDLARLAVTNSEEWRGLRKQFNEVDAAITAVTETEKRLKGEIATEADAIALSNHLTKESIAMRHADGAAKMKAAQEEREGVGETMRGISDRIVLLTKERDGIQDEIELQENLNDIIKERNEKILSAQNRKQEAEQRKAQAQATIKEYDEQEQKVAKLKQEKKELEDQQRKETREAEKSAKATEEQNKKQAELTQTVSTLKGEVGGLETSLQGLEEQIKKTSAEPIKPKVDTSKIDELQAKLKAVQDGIAEKNAQIEAESKKGGLTNKWQETLTRLQGDKDGRLSPMGLGDDKKQMDDILDVANNFYEIIKKVKGVTEDGFIPTPAAEPVKQLAEYYKITEEEARKLVKTLQKSEVVSKRFATFDYNEQTGFLAINRNNGKDDHQVRIEAAQSYMKAAERREGDLTENVNKLLADRKKLEEEEVEIKGKLKAATEGVAEATVKSGEATERRVNLTKKEKEEVKKLTDENNSLTGTIDALKKQLDSLSVSQDKVTGSVKEGAKAAKGEAEAVKMTAEEAKAALDKMREKSTFEFKGGKMVASNLEEAENSLISIVSKSGDYKAVLKAFQEKYQIKEKDQARDIIKQLAAGGKGGLIESGFEREGEFSFTLNEEKRAARIKTMKELLTLSKGVTVATQAQTQADEAQAAELERLNQVWKEKEKLYSQSNSRYLALMGKANSMEGPTEFQGQLTTKGEKLRDAEEYRKKHVAKNRQDANEAKQAYDDYAKSILDGTAATEANTKSQKDNVDVEKQRKQISEQISALEQQKAANTERITQLQEKGTKATKEQVKADGESVTTGKSMNELLQEKERITSRLTEKQAKLKEAQEELAKMTKEETAAGKEQSDVTEQLTKKTEEYNAETEKLANMKEGRNKARGVIRNADRSISNADDAIATLKNEATPQRKTESEIGAMKKRVAELTAEVDKETAAFNKNAQAITELNKKETQAAIDMAQSENVSIEKVKQSIELLQKKIQTEAADTETMKQRGEAINRLSERLTQMNAEVVKLSKPIADRLSAKDLGTLNETELQQGIDAAKQLLKTYKTGSDEAKQLAANIVRAEQYMDSVGIKAAKKAAQQAEEIKQERELHRLMNARLKDLSTLSADAMEETRKYWQAQMDGAERGSRAFKEAEKNLKAISAEQERLSTEQLKRQARRLNTKDLSTMTEQEVTESIKAAKQLALTMKPAEEGYKRLQDNIIRAEQHVKEFGLESERSMKMAEEKARLMNQRMKSLKTLSADALEETRKYWEIQRNGADAGSKAFEKAEANLKRIDNLTQKRKVKALDEILGDPKHHGISEVQQAVQEMEKLRDSVQKGIPAWQHYNKMVNEGKAYLDQVAKSDAAERIAEQMQKLSKLSVSGLADVKRYWQAQFDGAERGSQAYKDAEAALKRINEQENTRKAGQATRVLAKPENYGDAEIREAIQAMEQLRDAQAHGSAQWEIYNKRVEEGRRYLDEWKQVDSVVKFEGQMAKLPQLSDAALQETKKFWETMVAGAEKGSSELAQYEAHLEKVKQEERERRQLNDEITVQRLDGNLKNQSEQEISEAIEAGKRLIKTYETASPEAEALAKKIADAEEHLKKYGLEAERTARKEAQAVADAAKKRQESDDLMKQQLLLGASLSKEALKAQEQYWKHLIDDPKTAAASLADYQKQLDQVRYLQELMMQQEGSDALDFFRGGTGNASAEEIKRQADALKLFRNSLPQQDNADLIKEIDQYLEKAGETAKNTAKQMMSIREAYTIGLQVNNGTFRGSTDQLNRAKKTLEELQQRVEKGGRSWQKLQRSIEGINLELKRTETLSDEVQQVLDKPKGRSLNDLKNAVEQARLKLQSMDRTTKDGQKAFDELAKKIKATELELKQMSGEAKASVSAFDKAWSRLKTYVGLYVGASVAMNKLVGTMGDLMDLSDKMGEVRKTTGFTADEVGRLSGELKKMDTRTALNGLLDLSVAAGQLGLKTEEDVLGFTEAANKLMVALPEMGREGATEMLKVALATGEIDKIRKQMEQGLIEGSSATAVAMEKVGSTIDRLRATSAATAPAITDFVKRVGAVGAQSGITIDQVAALGSTVDALGMRVEMSATALSRMIPAIKNNAFDVAKAIGVAPEYLRGLFDEAGGGMKAMLMIFQHIKDSGMSEDNIEKMLGMGNLKEIMKELNQQGARAGIVFSGLSQNVDTLREHLSTASDAYRENVAIQQEYEKMNETTMAKWERLKNEIEEMFVGDGAQRFLGGIIDGIREIVDLLTGPLKGAAAGLGAGLSAYKMGLGSLLEKMWDFARGEEDVTEKWKEWTEKLKDKDVWGIVTSGVIAAGVAIYTYVDSLQEAAREAAKFARDVVDEQNKVENLTKAIGDAKTKVEEADKEVEKARKAVDEAKKSLDGTKESTDRLTEANSKLLVSEEKKRNEMATQKKLIETFNNEYGKYLGFMLSEVSSNYELIKARDLANTKLRETIALKRKEAALGRIEESEGEGRDEAYAALSQAVSGSIRKQVVTGHDKNGKEIKTWANDQEATTRLLRDLTKMAQAQNMTAREVEKALADAGLNIYEKRNGKQQINTYGANLRNLVMNYRNEYQAVQSKIKDVETQFDVEASIDREEAQGKLKEQFKASEKNYADLETSYAKAQGDARKQAAANLLKQADTLEEMISAAPNYYDLSNDTEKAAYEKFVTDTQKRIDGIKEQREALLKEAGTLYKSRKTVQGETTTSLTPTSPWGGNAPADSTDYGTWDVNELVARRNQMDKFKNVLKPDTDIRAVLAEDKALMKALDNGLKEDWKSVLGWYNTERKKIQEELKSERFSTNEGHWRDEKQGRGRKNRFRESDYALAELDRYYSKRKEDLEKARIEENMSEELFNRQAELLEQEHLERRSKLRETFTAGSTEQEKKMVKQFREWWDQLEKQGLLDEVPWATVESEWSKALASEIGRNNLRAQQDLTKLQEITVKHLNEIAKLIDKERPYDGITANLRKNLTEMDILLADMQKDGPEKDTAKLVKAETMRLKFLLSEAEQAYSLNFEQLKEKMIKEGFGEWAQAIEGDEQLKQSLMQNLRNTYDAIQEAIKKESSVIKKQLEIQWNDLMPGSDMSMKGTFEKAVSDLGLAGDQVKRANSLIGAGTASDRVADKLGIQQMRIQLQMQETYFALMQKIGRERIKQLEQSAAANEREAKALKEKAELLRKEGKTAEAEVTELKAQNALRQSLQDKFDAEHAAKSLSLARTKELAEEEKQRVAIANQLAESQNRLYTDLKSWADLLSSSLQSVFEASHTADREYYNERAKLDLTGNGGPGAGTYIVIENEGTDDARAHYEYLDERQALERQREIENDNAVAEAWKKMLDDLNQKMSETITDQINAMLQSQSIDANTQAVIENTRAIYESMGQGVTPSEGSTPRPIGPMTEEEKTKAVEDMTELYQASNEIAIAAETEKAAALDEIPGYTPSPAVPLTDEQIAAATEKSAELYGGMADLSDLYTNKFMENQAKMQKSEQQTDQKMAAGAQSTFAKMTAAANLYGIAYQTMSNDNLSAAQKFEMLALQAAGQAAMSMLTMDLAKEEGKTTMMMPGILGKLFGEMPYPAAIATFAVITALMGGLMGLAVSQVTKSKSQISQATGTSMNAGRLSAGMMTYAEGNVNAFTDPATLTPGRSYNVDAADGRTYRAKYTGTNPKTHITSGPEFHLVGERGQEAIIDAKTTRQIRMDDNGIWQSIQTLYNGGRLSASRRRRAGRGMAAFADGNMDEFEEIVSGTGTGDGASGGMSTEQMAAFQSSLDRNNELLERALSEGIHARFDVYGKGGLIDSYDTGKKTVSRHGEKF